MSIVVVGGVDRRIGQVESYLEGGGKYEDVRDLLDKSRANRLMMKEYEKMNNRLISAVASGRFTAATFEPPPKMPEAILNKTRNVESTAKKLELAMANLASEMSEKYI